MFAAVVYLNWPHAPNFSRLQILHSAEDAGSRRKARNRRA
jgi:hypothetical protein